MHQKGKGPYKIPDHKEFSTGQLWLLVLLVSVAAIPKLFMWIFLAPWFLMSWLHI